MINTKSLSIATDGSYKRIAITYDKIDESGKVISSNNKINRVITDSNLLDAIAMMEEYAKTIVESENK